MEDGVEYHLFLSDAIVAGGGGDAGGGSGNLGREGRKRERGV